MFQASPQLMKDDVLLNQAVNGTFGVDIKDITFTNIVDLTNTIDYNVLKKYFDKKVQIAINRIQPAALTEKLLTSDIRDKFKAVNFDLLVGLPEQTIESLKNTVSKVCEMSPDRVSLAYLHYGPKYHVHQRLMLKDGLLPDFYERKELFEEAVNILLAHGYVRTGFEHFALPTDAVAKAAKKKTALYNSLGSTFDDIDKIEP